MSFHDGLMGLLKGKIEAELSRLDILGGDSRPRNFVVNVHVRHPAGWVQVANDNTAWYGKAGEILVALEGALDGESVTDRNRWDRWSDKHSGLHAAYRALRPFEGRDPLGGDAWRDSHEFVGIEVKDLGLVVLRTNGGLKWGFAPTDPEFAATNSTHDFSGRFDRADEALDAAWCGSTARTRARGSDC